MEEVLVDHMEQDLSVWSDVEEYDEQNNNVGQVPVDTTVSERRETNYHTSHFGGSAHQTRSTRPSNAQ